MAQGYLEQSALTQKRDAADAEARYRQGTLKSQALDRQVKGTEFLIQDTQAKLENIRKAKLQAQGDVQTLEKLAAYEASLLDAGATLIGQLGQMTGMDMSQVNPREMLAAGSGTPFVEDKQLMGANQQQVGTISGRKGAETGPAPQPLELMWQDNQLLLADPNDGGSVTSLFKGATGNEIPDAKLVMDVKGPDGTVAKWIHSSIMPEGFDKSLLTGKADDINTPLGIFTQTGYVPVSEGGPNTSIAPAWLLHPNPAPGQARIVPYNKNTMPDAEYQAHLTAGYLPVGTPGWGTADKPGVQAAGLTDADTSKALDQISKSAVAATNLSDLYKRWTNAGETVAGLTGRLRSGVGGVIGGYFGDWAEEKWTDVLNEMSDTDVSVEEMAALEADFKAQVSETVKVFTGEESGRITQEERKVAAEAQAASVAGKSFKQAQQAMLHILVMHEAEMMRINALLDRPYRYDMSKPDQLNAYGQKLYKDLGGSGDPATRKNREIQGAVEGMIDRLERIQDAVNATVRGQGSKRDVAWAKYKATN
tara:strand:+ start:1 stop:1605 length:1605 start_codon:yes stop_codon:yes gene_type:complete